MDLQGQIHSLFIRNTGNKQGMLSAARAALGSLPMVARALLKKAKKPLRIVIDRHATTGSTDCETLIRLPVIPMPTSEDDIEGALDLAALMYGLIHHEVGHCNHSDISVIRAARSGLEQALTNIIEDVRMENAHIRELPSSRAYLDAMNLVMAKQGKWGVVHQGLTPECVFLNYVLCRVNAVYRNEALSLNVLAEMRSMMETTFTPEITMSLDEVLEEMATLMDSRDSFNLARKVVTLLQNEQQTSEQQESDQQQQKQPPQSSDSSDEAEDEQSQQQGDSDQTDDSEADSQGESSKDDAQDQPGDPTGDDEATGEGDSSDANDDSSQQDASGTNDQGDGDQSDATEDQSGDSSDSTEGKSPGDSGDSDTGQSGTDGQSQSQDQDAPEQSDGDSQGQATTPGQTSTDGEGQGNQPPSTISQKLQQVLSNTDDKGSDRHDAAHEMLQQLVEAIAEHCYPSLDLEDAISQLEASVNLGGKHGEQSGDLVTGANHDLDAGYSAAQDIRRRLLSELDARTNADVFVGQKGRRLSSRHLDRVMTGDPRVFRNTVEGMAPSTAVMLVQDVSGSMYGERISLASQALYATAIALEGIEGIEVGAMAFPGNGKVIGFGESPRFRQANFQLDAWGCTPMAEGINVVTQALLEQQQTRRLMVVLTDGEPDNAPLAQAMIATAESYGIEVFGVGIQTDSVKRLFKRWIEIHDINQLPDRLVSLVRDEVMLSMAA